MTDIKELGRRAKAASYILANATADQKNQALTMMADELMKNQDNIMEANTVDMAAAMSKNMPQAFLDRLLLTEKRIEEMAEGLTELVALPDPIGKIDDSWVGAQDIKITKLRVPIGVVGIIYEARPNVTADGAGICLKTGNAVILRGGSDAIQTNLVVGGALRAGIEAAGLPADAVQVVEDTARETANALMTMNEYLDLLVPRGGAGLIQSVLKNATVPVIETGVGNCHIFVDDSADQKQAIDIILNAKLQRPSVCNAAESLVFTRTSAARHLAAVAKALVEHDVEIRGCEETVALLTAAGIPVVAATEDDFGREYGALIISCKLVDDVQAAIAHINKYNSHHSDAILTQDQAHARLFQLGIDSAAVYVNASTRFTDGFQFGFGAEIGISTQKLHARGPMGLNEMTSYKYLITGEGQCRS